MATVIKKSIPLKKIPFPTKYNKRDMRQLVPTAQASLIIVLAECVKRGIPIFLVECLRLAAEQHKNFLSGASKLDSGFGVHEFRLAVDIACKGKKLYDPKIIAAAAVIFRKHGWIWGNDWDNDGRSDDETFHDSCHFQFVTIKEQATIYKLKTPELIEQYIKNREAGRK